jgi:hypothetical protein
VSGQLLGAGAVLEPELDDVGRILDLGVDLGALALGESEQHETRRVL